jgi:hypothetical protein
MKHVKRSGQREKSGYRKDARIPVRVPACDHTPAPREQGVQPDELAGASGADKAMQASTFKQIAAHFQPELIYLGGAIFYFL